MGKVESHLHITIILTSSVGSKMMQQTKVNTFDNKPHKCLSKLGGLKQNYKGSGITMSSCSETPVDTVFKSVSELSHIAFLVGMKRSTTNPQESKRRVIVSYFYLKLQGNLLSFKSCK